ncbi:YveK family protein [Priestia megaterium]|uniref:YveK family protein n=1 Tax=Priestia megaterium TaxID=1404 RepID=UPI0023DA3371|nr:Wzz/FepE/Etk N-terminal domain-containing protein [Priestia megaterium]MDF2013275.1 Wzz/FepE/Etk N-terminal domain-containing protein [Priestia megaterium]
MEENINIRDMIQILKKRWILIVVLTLIAGLCSGIISYNVLKPVYQASAQILVNQKKSDNSTTLDASQIQTNLQLINTYSVIIKSPTILGKVIEDLNLNQSVNELNQKVTVVSQENSQVFSVKIEDTNAANATKIVNAVTKTFKKEIPRIMNVDNITILTKAGASENPTPIKPNPLLNIAIAALVGLILGIGLAFVLEYIDNTIKREQDIEKLLGVPALGSIPKTYKNHEKNLPQRMGSETLEP